MFIRQGRALKFDKAVCSNLQDWRPKLSKILWEQEISLMLQCALCGSKTATSITEGPGSTRSAKQKKDKDKDKDKNEGKNM
jgi:hypothetical protein